LKPAVKGGFQQAIAEDVMKKVIEEEIRRFVLTSPDNRFADGVAQYFEEPIIGYASATDPLFQDYKSIIGNYHLTPAEIMATCYGEEIGRAATVICWILPISRAAREDNRSETEHPSLRWAQTRSMGERFNSLLRKHVADMLTLFGDQAVAPLLSGLWRPMRDPPAGLSSTWSERHAAYAAGLGTFSLNDGLITEKGIAHRCGSVITDIPLEPTPRTAADPFANCLYFSKGGACGVCVSRCPAGAISTAGHDKEKCSAFVYGTLRETIGQQYGIMETGCGLCQTKVPCEACSPV
jgi:epoxyqueuosine reductase